MFDERRVAYVVIIYRERIESWSKTLTRRCLIASLTEIKSIFSSASTLHNFSRLRSCSSGRRAGIATQDKFLHFAGVRLGVACN